MQLRKSVVNWESLWALQAHPKNIRLKELILRLISANQEHPRANEMSVAGYASQIDDVLNSFGIDLGQPAAKNFFQILNRATVVSRTPQNAAFLPRHFPQIHHDYSILLLLLTVFLSNNLRTGTANKTSNISPEIISRFEASKMISTLLKPLVEVRKLTGSARNTVEAVKAELEEVLKKLEVRITRDRELNVGWKGVVGMGRGLILALGRFGRGLAIAEEVMEGELQEHDWREEQGRLCRAQVREANRQLSRWIKKYIQEQRNHNLEICFSCERRILSCDMEKHIKACVASYQIKKALHKIDAEISGKHDDLKTLATQAKRLELERRKEMYKYRLLSSGQRSYIKQYSKSNLQPINHHRFETSPSSSSSSNSARLGTPPKCPKPLKQLSTSDLQTYQWLADQLRLVSSKILTHRQSATMNIYGELKHIKNYLLRRFERLGVKDEQMRRVFDLMVERMRLMERLRRVEREGGMVGVQTIQFQGEEGRRRYRRNRRKRGSMQEGYFSGEDRSVSNYVNTEKMVSLNSFKKIGLIGKGKYGQVFLVKKKSTGMEYALKKVPIQDAKNYSEVNIFQVINSPYLVKAAFSFSQGNFHYFVMQYMPFGNFSSLLDERLYQSQAKQYLAEIVMAIDHLHQHEIVHRDIKPDNIVIDNKGHLKLTDYGLSEAGLIRQKQREEQERSYSRFMLEEIKGRHGRAKEEENNRIVGSPYFMAPEVLTGKKATKMSDWWSFGILAYYTLTGSVPFTYQTGKGLQELTKKVFELKIWPNYIEFGKGSNEISFQAKHFIEGLLTIDPSKRLGNDVEDIKSHNFFYGIDWDRLLQTPPYFAPNDQSTTIDSKLTYDSAEDDCFSSKSTNMSIRMDVLSSQTQNRYDKRQAHYKRLLAFADKLSS